MSRHGTGAESRPRYKRGAPDREQNRLRRSLSEWKLALRIARRSVWRSRGTSLIVVIMVMLPVAGFSAAAVIGQSTFPTPQEKIAAELGQNEAKLYTWVGPHSGMVQDPYDPSSMSSPEGFDPQQQPEEPLDETGVRALFPGVDMTVLTTTTITAETGHGVGQLMLTIGELWSDDFAGRTHIVDGAAPSAPGEVLVSEAALERLDAHIGDTITVTEPQAALAITGVLDDAMSMSDEEWIYIADTEAFDKPPATWDTSYYLPDTVITRDELAGLNNAGVTVLSRHVLESAEVTYLAPNGGFWVRFGTVLVLAAAFAIFEIVLLAGAAFAVGARKQQRALATLASVGGERRMLFRVVTSQGLVLGILGGIVGLAIGIPAAALFMRLTDDGSATQYWGFHADPPVLGGIALLAAIVGLVAAIAPARTAVKVDVLAALRGSRRPTQVSAKATAWGIGYLIGGLAATIIGAFALRALNWAGAPMEGIGFWLPLAGLVIGPIVLQVGMIMCGAAVLRAVARVVSRFGLGPRLAARDSAANRARSVPAFAAIMVTAFIAVVVINVSTTTSRANEDHYYYQAAPGQAMVWMPHEDDGAPAATVADLTAIVNDELETTETAAIYGPMSRWDPTTGAPDAGSTIAARAPAENICPLEEASADYDASIFDLTGAEYQSAVRTLRETDWRCDETISAGVNNANEIVATDAEGLALFLGRDVPEDVVDAFENGSAVALSPVYVFDGKTTLQWWEPDADWGSWEPTDEPLESRTIDALYVEPEVMMPNSPVVISRATAAQLSIDAEPRYILASPADNDFSQGTIDALNLRLEGTTGVAVLETGPEPTWLYVILATLLIAGVLFVGASAVAIGLSRADGRADDATLAAVGATRALRRSFAFWQAVVLVGIGTVTGTLAGLVTTYGISLTDTTGYLTFDPPWLAIGALVVGMPLAIAIGSWLVASKPTTLARRVAIG